MAKGKKTDNETIYKVMLSYVVTNNYSETARQLDMPITTVEKIVKDNKDKEKFVKLCDEKKEEFVEKANKIIDKATTLLDRRLDTALDRQTELDELLDNVYDVSNDDMKPKEKLEIAKKLSRIQLNGLNEITTAIGTMYDKRALARGEATSNTNNTINISPEDKKMLDAIYNRLK